MNLMKSLVCAGVILALWSPASFAGTPGQLGSTSGGKILSSVDMGPYTNFNGYEEVKTNMDLTYHRKNKPDVVLNKEVLIYYPRIRGVSVRNLCVSPDGSAFTTLKPITVCTKPGYVDDNPNGCLNSEDDLVTFPRANSLGYCDAEVNNDGLECTHWTHKEAPLTYTVSVSEIVGYRDGQVDTWHDDDGSKDFQFNVPVCSK